MKKLKKIAILPDCHLPFEDEIAYPLALRAIKKFKPDILVIIGDYADIWSMSAHDKDPARKLNLEDELEYVNAGLDEIEAMGIKEVVFCEGNHETRISRYMMQRAPDAHSMFKTQKLLQIKERGWKFVPYRQHIRIGKLHFTHDVGRSGKHAASQSLADFGHNLVIGHTHRGAVIYGGTVRGETHLCLNVGWLGSVEAADYMHRAKANRDWTHGFGIAYLEPNGIAHAHFVPIINGRCVVEGKLVK